MIIYRGRGFLVAVIAFGCLLVTELFTRSHFHDDAYYKHHGLPKLAGLVVAAAIVWLLGPRHSNETSIGVENIPPAASLLRDQDTFFFIPLSIGRSFCVDWPLSSISFLTNQVQA